MDLAELLTVETSVLRTLCLTVNSESSELKRQITENLIVDDFYFPITKSIFSAISDLAKENTNVDPNSLGQTLSRRSVDVPDDFFLEDLFRGEAPSPQTLTGWIRDLNAQKSGGDDGGDDDDEPGIPEGESPRAEEHYLEKTHPSVRSKVAETPTEPAKSSNVEAARPEPAGTTPKKQEESAATRSAKEILAPESGEWLGFLAELTKNQGEHLKTGFAGLDAEWGGIGAGLLLLAGEERVRLLDFLKQLVDQIATRCHVPCLYLSFERSKAELRLATLSRLSEAPSTHIRDGRYDKDSAEWQSIIRAGEQAVEWLQRIYTVEATPGLAVTGIRELRQGLMDSGAGATCLIAIDNLQKLASKSDLLQSVAELKELAESLGIVVIGVADNVEIVHERSADMAVTFTENDSVSILEVHASGAAKPSTLRFDYHAETHRFEERL